MTARNVVVNAALNNTGWFNDGGAYVVCDGQYGSTGKGLLASAIAQWGIEQGKITRITSNAGPNSGHTAYSPYSGEKIMTQQLPISTVIARQFGKNGSLFPRTYLNGGAIINAEILLKELADHDIDYNYFNIHPKAAVIHGEDIREESVGSVAKIASTSKGVGHALARKILRRNNVVDNDLNRVFEGLVKMPDVYDWSFERVFVEVSQGFSLGLNQRFYPYCTSRECTVQQALSDANIPARRLRKVAACYRTFPIRVGNTTQGHSGGHYPDQRETSWEELKIDPEITSVTKRVRRVFTWSWQQFADSLRANEPDLLFINFMNYLPVHEHVPFLRKVEEHYGMIMRKDPDAILIGFGPRITNIGVWDSKYGDYQVVTGEGGHVLRAQP